MDCASDSAEVFRQEILESKARAKNDEVIHIMEEFIKHIEVSSANFSAIDLIKQLEENKAIENQSHMFFRSLLVC